MKISAYTLLASIAMTLLFSQISFADKPDGDQPKLFQTLDKNKDGKLTKEDISDEQKNHFERLLRIGDKDNNGELTLAEFKQSLLKKDETVTTEKGLSKGKAPVAGKNKKAFKKNKDNKGKLPENLFNKLDKNMDGKLSGDELTKNGKTPGFLKRVYTSLNKKEGDEITKEEFTKAFGNFAKKAGNKRTANKPETPESPEKGKKNKGPGNKFQKGNRPPLPKFYILLDADHDHKLSKEELSKAADLLAKLDKDKDGSLSPHEILGPPPRPNADGPGQGKNQKLRADNRAEKKREFGGGKRIDKMIEKMDKNEDGKLSKEELPPFMQKNMEKIDTDGDGSVSKEELTKSFELRFKNRKKKEN